MWHRNVMMKELGKHQRASLPWESLSESCAASEVTEWAVGTSHLLGDWLMLVTHRELFVSCRLVNTWSIEELDEEDESCKGRE